MRPSSVSGDQDFVVLSRTEYNSLVEMLEKMAKQHQASSDLALEARMLKMRLQQKVEGKLRG